MEIGIVIPIILLKLLIGSCSGPWGINAPITKDSWSSPLHECQKPEGKITGGALVESCSSVLTFDLHKTQEGMCVCAGQLDWKDSGLGK